MNLFEKKIKNKVQLIRVVGLIGKSFKIDVCLHWNDDDVFIEWEIKWLMQQLSICCYEITESNDDDDNSEY